jgi:hypothetical protein
VIAGAEAVTAAAKKEKNEEDDNDVHECVLVLGEWRCYVSIIGVAVLRCHGVFTPFVQRPLRRERAQATVSLVGEDDLQGLLTGGIAKGVVGAHDITELEAV